MSLDVEPWHAHIYARPGEQLATEALRARFAKALVSDEIPGLRFVGHLALEPVGPHPLPQFEIHFIGAARAHVRAIVEQTGLVCLIHPLTDDDLADHTSLAIWIGEALTLEVSVLDPPGVNQGLSRFGQSDF